MVVPQMPEPILNLCSQVLASKKGLAINAFDFPLAIMDEHFSGVTDQL
jgi:hypothetical protein